MCSIKDGLESVGLEMYVEAFQSKGMLLVNDLVTCSPEELARIFNEICMLKGHTFKMKKLIDDIKAGVQVKPRPANQLSGSGNFGLNSSFGKLRPDLTQNKMSESNFKDFNERPTENLSQGLIIGCLKDFLAVDLENYYKALCQLRHIQNSIRGLVGEEIMKLNNI